MFRCITRTNIIRKRILTKNRYESVMLLLCANLQRLEYSYVNPKSVFDDEDENEDEEKENEDEEKENEEKKDKDYLPSLRNLLLEIIEKKSTKLSKDLPAEVLYHGRQIFFPSEEARSEMAVRGVRAHTLRCQKYSNNNSLSI